MNAYIRGFSAASPRTQEEMLSDYLVNEFNQKNILPARIFSMADYKRANSVKFSQILESMMKMMPHFTKDFVDQIPYAFQMSPSDMVSREEFDMLFDIKKKMAAQTPVNAVKKKNAMEKSKPQDNFQILKYLAECCVKENLTAARLFKLADKNFNQVLTVDELKE